MNDRIARTPSEVREAFGEQIEMLVLTTKTFDQGNYVIGKQIATILRTLLYAPTKRGNTRTIPLLTQLKLNKDRFLSTAYSADQMSVLTGGKEGIIAYCGLLDFYVSAVKAGYYAPLDDRTPSRCPHISYAEWLNQTVLRDKNGKIASRLNLISLVADTDGGAHVDAALPAHFSAWKNGVSMGLHYSLNENSIQRIKGVELHALRQIAHEVIRTIQGSAPWAFRSNYEYPMAANVPEVSSKFANGVVFAGGAKMAFEETTLVLSSDS